MTVQTSDDSYSKLRHKAKERAASGAYQTREDDEPRLIRLIQEVSATQNELMQRNQELLEKNRAIDTARNSYAKLYEKYVDLFDFAPNGYLVLDQEGTVADANQTATLMFNVPKKKLVGRRMADFFHGDHRGRFLELNRECAGERKVQMAELDLLRAGNDGFTAQVQIQAFPAKQSPRLEFRVTLVDISEKVRATRSLALLQQVGEIAGRAENAEVLLKEVVGRIRAYCQCDGVGIRLRDAQGNIPYQAYEGFSRAFYESESPLSLHTDQCMCIKVIKGRTDSHQDYFTTNGSFYINGTTRFLATIAPEQQGKTRNACNAHGYESVALVPIYVSQDVLGLIHVADHREDRVPLSVVEVLESIGLRIGLTLQRFYMQDQLRLSLCELGRLSSHLLKAKEDEQRRIAMELHDQSGQDLNVLKLRIKSVHDKLRKDQPGLRESCSQMMTYVDKLIDDVRRLAHDLTPTALESLGLGGALRQMVREFSQYSGLKIKTRMAPLEHIVDREARTGLFRIIQEALTNVYKHARATEVGITAIDTAKGLRVTVRDNGRGFEMKAAEPGAGPGTSMGLATMRLRAEMIGARLTIATQPGQGTRIKIILPKIKKG